MALSIGWRANDIRESIWKDDPALANVPVGALEAWREDGDASHLEPYATSGKPTIVRWRALNADQKPIAQAPMTEAENNWEGANRAWIRCFRMAVTIDGMEESATSADGEKHRLTVRERGIQMMALEVVDELMERYPGMVQFYGHLVYMASFLSDVEKKASSPPSTGTPSPAAASTVATTEPSPPVEAATAAP